MFKLATFLILSSAALALDLADGIQSGDFWKQKAQTSLQGVRCSLPDAEHIRTSGLQFGELTTGEVIISVADDKPVSLQAMLYNKGDNGIIDADSFDNILSETRSAMDTLTGTRAKLRKAGKGDSAVKLKSWEWKWENGVIRLEANSSGKKKDFEAEFIRLTMGPDAKALGGGGARDTASKSDLRSSITTDEDGTVWLKNVPMVDQGQKGYCVPATLARVFAFYGMDKVDQHALAAVCDSSADGGTTTLGMEQAMRDVCKKFHTKFIVIDDYVTNLKSALDSYNKYARRADKEPLGLYDNVFGLADPKVLRQARAGKNAQISRWMKDIKKNIDSGTPVIWMVMLGIYQEEIGLPQSRGGHARLIIGYNLKKKTIIYTDSWGAEHARKTIKAEDAIGMTTGRYVIKLR